MTRILRSSGLAIVVSLGWAIPAQAQGADAATIQQELSAMRAQMAAMAARIDTLESELDAAQAKADAAQASALAASEAAGPTKESAQAGPVSSILWKGAPEIETDSGWSFKPRGRLQFDAGFTSAPTGPGVDDGVGGELRRARLGVEGKMPGGFAYKFEADFAGTQVEVTDAVIGYVDGDTRLAIGQHNGFQGLEELTSTRFSSFIERAAFTDAFNFERRVGVSLEQKAGDAFIQAGVFGSNIEDEFDSGWSLDGRAVYAPKLGDTQLHLGGSVHYRELENFANSVRYRQRPLVHFTSNRFIDTGNIAADTELGYGFEAAAIHGPLHFAAEGFWQHAGGTPMASDPTFFGGYAEVGYFITGGDTRGYKNGIFDRVKPHAAVGDGGFGALQLNLRYDYLDLNDAGIVGGIQNAYQVALIWTPTDYTRFLINYGRMDYDDAVIPAANGDTSYGVDAFGMRAQVDF